MTFKNVKEFWLLVKFGMAIHLTDVGTAEVNVFDRSPCKEMFHQIYKYMGHHLKTEESGDK